MLHLSIVLPKNNELDSNNSTTAPLGAGATFTGTGTEVLKYQSITISVFADQDSAADGMQFQFSQDNANWDESNDFNLVASTSRRFQFPVIARYFRVKYTNGTTPQGAFRIQTILHTSNVLTSIHRVDQGMTNDRSVTVTKSVIAGETTAGGGSFVNVKVSPSGSLAIDLNGATVNTKYADSPSIDAFARARVSSPQSLFHSKLLHDAGPILWDDAQVSGSGTTSTHSTDTASATIGVALNTAGKRVRQTFMRFNYQPGKSQLILLTGTLKKSGGGAGIKRGFGLYDDDNGIFLQDNIGTPEMVIKSHVSGAPIDTAVTQLSWNLDTMDGNGESGINLDFTKSQILFIDFEWLGAGRVRTGFVVDGIPVYCHEFLHANVLSGVYMSTPNLPIRYEISNDGTGALSTLEHICSTVISEGGTKESGPLFYKSTEGTHLVATAENTIYAVLGMQLKSTHLDATIKIQRIAIQIQDASNVGEWILLFNPTVAGTFTYNSITNSAVSVAVGVTANTVSGGRAMAGGFAQSTTGGGGSGGVTSPIENLVRLGAKIDGTRDTIVLCWRPTGGTSAHEIEGSLTWRELS